MFVLVTFPLPLLPFSRRVFSVLPLRRIFFWYPDTMRFLFLFAFYVLCSFIHYGFSINLLFDCGSPSGSLYHGGCSTEILIQGNYYCKDEALVINKFTIEINSYDVFSNFNVQPWNVFSTLVSFFALICPR